MCPQWAIRRLLYQYTEVSVSYVILQQIPFEKRPAQRHVLRRNSWVSFSLWNSISWFFHQNRYDLLSKSGAMWGTSVEFWHRYVIVDRLNLVLRFFSATLFTIRSHLDQSHNQIPQNVRYQNSNLEPLTNVGSCSEAERFLAEIVLESYKCLLF